MSDENANNLSPSSSSAAGDDIASSALPPPSIASAVSVSGSEQSLSSIASGASGAVHKKSGIPLKASGIKPPTKLKIDRPCHAEHLAPKAALPADVKLQENQTPITMRRPSDDFSRSPLTDVDEEGETVPDYAAIVGAIEKRRSVSPRRSSISPDLMTKPPKSADRKTSNGSVSSELYWEATGRRRSSDQGIVLTTDTDSFIIGQRVWVGGLRPGQIAYIGETHFAPGEWAGVVLDEPNGKNDGCVSGKRYFQCEPKKGIFSRLTRLTHEPLPGADEPMLFNRSNRSSISPARSTAISPPGSVRSVTPKGNKMTIGDRVIVSSGMGSRPGILRFMGETKFAPGTWCGIQLDDPTGKNNGSVDGVSYFSCPDKRGIFVPVAKVTLSPSAKINRMSRAGSRESLVSVGTIGSVTSTATSRLRASAQRLSTSSKPLSTPKSTFSLQDILREKQNHIEQLLIEKDIDRQDAENQALRFQKDIGKCKDRIYILERQLDEERKKTEDLQFSIDEATVNGEELNAQTKEYKDQIDSLEKQILVNSTTFAAEPNLIQETVSNAVHISLQNEHEKLLETLTTKEVTIQKLEFRIASLENEIVVAREKLEDTEQNLEIKISGTDISEHCLRDEINILESQVENLKTNATKKDAEFQEQLKKLADEKVDVIRSLEEQIQTLTGSKNDETKKLLEDKVKDEEKFGKLLREFEELTKLKTDIEADASGKSKTIIDLQSQLTQLQAGYEELQKVITALKDEITGRNLKLKTQESQFLELQTKYSEKVDSLSQLASGSDVIAQELKELRAQIEAQNLELEKLRKELDLSVANNQQLNAANSQLEKVLEGKCEEIKTIESEIANKTQDSSKLSNDKNELQLTCDKLQSELNNIVKSKLELEKDKEELKEQINKNIGLVKDLETKLQTQTGANTDLNTEIINFKTEISKKDENCEQLKAELSQLSAKFDEKIGALANLESGSDVIAKELANFKAATEEQKLEIGKLNGNLEAKSKELEESLKAAKDIASKVEEKDAAIKILESKVTEELKKQKLESAQHENNLSIKVKEIESLSVKLDAINGELQAKNVALEELQNTKSIMETQIFELKQSNTDRTDAINQLEDEKKSLQLEIEMLKSTSHNADSAVLQATNEINATRKRYDELFNESKETRQQLERQIRELTETNTAKTLQFEALKNEIELLTAQKIDRENELNVELANLKEISEAEHDALKQEVDTLRAGFVLEKEKLLKDIEKELENSNALKTSMNTSITNLETNIGELNTQLDTAKSQLASQQETSNAVIAELKCIEEQLRAELTASQLNQDTLKTSISTMQQDTDALKQNFQSEKDKLLHEISEKLENSDGLKCQMNASISNLEESVRDLRKQLDAAKSQLTSHSETSEAVIAELKVTEEKLRNELKATIANEENLKLSLSESSKSSEAAIQEKSNIITELNTLKSQLEQQTIDLQQLNISLTGDINERVQTIAQLEEKLKNSENENNILNDTLSNNLTKLEEQTMQYKEMEDEQIDLVTRSEETQRKFTELSEQYANLTASKMQLDEILSTKTQEIEALHTNISTMTNECTEKTAKITELQTHYEQLTSSVNICDDLKTELLRKSEEIHMQSTSISKLQDSVTILEKAITEKDLQFTQILSDSELATKSLSDELQQKSTTISDFQNQLAAKEVRIAELMKSSEENNNTTQEVMALKEKLQALEKVELENGKRLTVAGQELAKVKEEKVAMAEAFSKLKKESDELRFSAVQKDLEIKITKDQLKSQPVIVSEDDPQGQINFLNAIIADMHKKNENLTSKLCLLETTYTTDIEAAHSAHNSSFDVQIRRKPAPRLYCDICDEFDLHETEDCPLQSSDSPPPRDPNTERKLPSPRKYCEACETFGHEMGECNDDETF